MSEQSRKAWQNFKASNKYKNILADSQAKIYLLDKPKKVTSFKAIIILRKILNLKRVGFSGTLDPLASGLLILATGKATQLLDYFHYLPKVYLADILFGQVSETYDLEGELKVNSKAKPFVKNDLLQALTKFKGSIKQQAPAFSAKKVEGQKLYKLARAGKKIDPPIKEVEIYKIKVIKFKYPKVQLLVECSAGTYIRSLAHDLGQELKTGAVLTDLRRLSIGKLSLDNAPALDKIDKDTLITSGLPVKDVIDSLDQYFCQ
ncbi:tRNA pseudouridine(55) synthase TruB [Candidatus Parcubacteria bacterium]|nr:MAG: tRNA pseudouridine(55) synthase TruB [Candidatus Parcubacteria bacterium]